jgi:carbon-monoxide dehydrogenase small subunit
MTHLLELTVNGQPHRLQVEPRSLLVEVLRESLRLTGTHVGCDTSQCGCCTVLLDGDAVKSCTVLALQAQGRQVTTIEGLADPAGRLHPVQQAFTECHALQCGFCTPGMVMATVGLLRCHPRPTAEQIEEGLSGNLCRCTGYAPIAAAVERAANLLAKDEGA